MQPQLVALVQDHPPTMDDVTVLLGLIREGDWPRLRAALHEAVVDDARRQLTDNATEATCRALAVALYSLGILLGEVAEHRQAQAATEEAVTLYRGLVAAALGAYTPDLALSLNLDPPSEFG